MTLKKLFVILLLTFSCIAARADVDLKTGDFHVTYKDADLAELKGASIERMYNSASRSTGLFGYGWTSIYETRLYVIGDGNILVKEMGSSCATCAENGSGNASILIREKGFFELFFTPATVNQARIDQNVNQIIQVLIRDRRMENNPVEIARKRKELLASMSLRAAEWIRYADKGWLSTEAPLAGSKWFSTNGELQNIELTSTGFTRNYNDKSREGFDTKGILLTRHDYAGALKHQISYTDGKISRVTDGMGNVFSFQVNDRGLVTAIQVKNDKVTYEYDEQGMLLRSKGADKLIRTYTYHSNRELIAVKDEKSDIRISYDPRTSRVSQLKQYTDEGYLMSDRSYIYRKILRDDGSVDPYRFTTVVVNNTDEKGVLPDSVVNEYQLKEIMGRPYTYKTVITDGGLVTETVFTECGCGPLSIKKGARYATFKYDGKSRMIEKDNNEYILRASYDDRAGKINHFERKEKDSDETTVTDFTYAENGDLVEARSKDLIIRLEYNEKRNIVRMSTSDKVLLFKYNEINKPIEITIENLGSIQVSYDEKGEIKSVTSESGHSMALQVTQAFQELLTVTRPEGMDYRLN